MASEKEKLEIIIEAKERASQEIQKLRSQLNALGGTDAVKAQKEINKLNHELSTLGIGAKKSAPMFSRFIDGIAIGNMVAAAASKAFHMLTGAIKDGIGEAADSVKVWNALSASMERHNISLVTGTPLVKQYAASLMDLTGVSDELAAKSLQRFIDTNNSLNDSMRLTSAALDFAVAKDMDFVEASSLLAKSLDSKVNALGRYGIAIDKTLPRSEQLEQMLGAINARFGGAAAAEMETNVGQWKRMNQYFSEIKEGMGAFLINSGAVGAILKELAFDAKWWANVVAPAETAASVKSLAEDLKSAAIELRDLEAEAGSYVFGGSFDKEIKAVEDKIVDLQYKLAKAQGREEQAGVRAKDEKAAQDAITNLEDYRLNLRIKNEARLSDLLKKGPQKIAQLPLSPIKDWRDEVKGFQKDDLTGLSASLQVIGEDNAEVTQRMAVDWRQVGSAARNMFQEMKTGKVQLSSILDMLGMIPGLGILGTIGSFLPFDDPINDAALRHEQRNIGRIVAQGISQGMQSTAMPNTNSNTITINVGSGVSAQDFRRLVKTEIVPAIEELSKNNQTKIVTKYKRTAR